MNQSDQLNAPQRAFLQQPASPLPPLLSTTPRFPSIALNVVSDEKSINGGGREARPYGTVSAPADVTGPLPPEWLDVFEERHAEEVGDPARRAIAILLVEAGRALQGLGRVEAHARAAPRAQLRLRRAQELRRHAVPLPRRQNGHAPN